MTYNQQSIIILSKTRELLSDKKSWTKHSLGRTADGTPVSWNDPKAECYCLSGAVRKVTPHKFAELAIFIVYELAWHLPKQFKSVVEFNDSFQTDHKDVLNYLDKVIAIKKRVAERSIKNEQN